MVDLDIEYSVLLILMGSVGLSAFKGKARPAVPIMFCVGVA